MSSNIKVAIRIRPLISREKNEKLKEQWEVSKNCMFPIDITTGKRNGDVYYFDHIFDSTYYNADIYNTVVHPVVDKAMNGFNGTIFAYGQTSSGKTYTMMGSTKEDGLISIAVQNVFLAIEQSVNRQFLLRVSYMEIYNEKIYDLLDIKNSVKISEDYSGSVIVNVKEEITDCAEKVYDIMKKGDKARRIGETNMNEKSSRSHTIFRIIIESSDINDTGVVNVAHLNLVDLAGSERATHTKATGQRLKEGAHINKSLSTLSLVMKQLSESQDYINFRDSKLTRILQPSLGGNALTAIICAVTPAALEETHSTLAFASRAKTVKNKPLLNEVVSDEALINRYASEINQLKKDLELANDNRTLQAQKIAMLEKCILFSKKTNVSNKNRRKTWSAPHDTNRALPVIYETAILRFSDYFHSTSDNTINLQNTESKALDLHDISVDMIKSTPISDKEKISLTTPIKTNTPSGTPDTQVNENLKTPFKKSEDVMKWLLNSTDTPASVLRDRAEYYEYEFNTLKELTTREKLLLMNEHNTELESIKLELVHIKNELECERKIRKEQESKFLSERKILNITVDEIKLKNEELLKQNIKYQEECNIKNDSEYLVEVYKEKYKKREKELLESLQEARDTIKLNSFRNNTDDEKNEVISTGGSISSVMQAVVNKCKNLLISLKLDLEADQPIHVVQNIFTELKSIIEEMVNNYSDCPEEFQEVLSIFSYIFDLITIVFSDDTLIQSLENDKQLWQSREKTYKLLVSKQDEEIKHLSDNILQYMNELTSYKNEVTKYKDLYRLETSIHTDLDFSLNDTKNEYMLQNSVLDKSQLILNAEKYVQTDEDISTLIQAKDNEIEDLSNKIMEYVEELTSLEKELKMFKTVSSIDQSIQTDIDEEIIEAILEDDIKYLQQINSLEEEMKILKDQLETEKKMHEDEKSQLIAEKQEVINTKNIQLLKLQTLINDLQKYEEVNKLEISLQTDIDNKIQELKKDQYIQTEENIINLIEFKDKEILDLSDKLIEYSELHTSIEQELETHKQELEINHDLLQAKDKLIQEMTLKIDTLSNQLCLLQEELSVYKSTTVIKKDVIEDKDKQITELIENISLYIKKLSDQEEKYENMMEMEQNKLVIKENEIEELNFKLQEFATQLSTAKEELQKYKFNENSNKQEIEQLKTMLSQVENELQMNKINTEQIELKTELYKLEEELKLHKYNEVTSKQEIEQLKTLISNIEGELKEYKVKMQEEKQIIQSKDIENLQLMEKVTTLEEELKKSEAITNNDEYFLKIEIKEEEIKTVKKKLEMTEKELKKIKEACNAIESDIIDSKNEEIKELSSKILEYINNITSLEMNIKDQDDTIKMKDNEIERISSKLVDYIDQLTSLKQKLDTLHSNIQIQHKEIDSKDTEIEDLSTKIMEYLDQLTTVEKKLTKCESDLQIKDNEIKSKNKEFEEFTSKIINYENQITSLEENLKKYYSNIQIQDDEIRSKNNEIREFTTKIRDYITEITSLGEKLMKYESDLVSKEDLINIKNKEILSLNDIIKSYETDTKEKDVLISKDKEIEEYINKLSSAQTKIYKYELEIQEIIENCKSDIEKYKNNIIQKDETINNLTVKIQILENNICVQSGNIKELLTDISNKEEIIIFKENDIKSLKEKIHENSIKLDELYKKESILKVDSCCQTDSYNTIKKNILQEEAEKWSNMLKTEENNSKEYINRINILEQKLITFHDQTNQMKTEYETMQNSCMQYTTENENLKQQICSLHSQMTHLECTLQQCKDFINQLETERKKLIENSNLLRNTSLIEIQKLTDKLQEKSKYIENLQKELITVQNNGQNTNLTEEMSKLKQKNEDYKKIVSQITEKANLKITSYNNIIVKLKQDNELLKGQIVLEKESNQSLQNQILVLQEEMDKRMVGKYSGYNIVKLQSNISHLEEDNRKLKKLNETSQEQIYSKSQELCLMKKSIESIKSENIDLVNKTKDLHKILKETEDQLKSTTANLQLLEKEKENYSDNARVLQESLEDIKFELYELKNKEREKFKKIKRQSLHDSSRSISSDEHLNMIDENKKINLQSFESRNSDEFKAHDNRLPLSDKKSDEQCDNYSKLQNDYEKLRKKNDQLTNLCKIRKQKIDELQRKLQI